MLFKFLTLFVLHAAEVEYVRTSYNFTQKSPEAKLLTKCTEIPYSYLEELEGFRRVTTEIQTLLHGPDYFARAGEITQLSERMKTHSERLNEMARPEWNTEIYSIYLEWKILLADFFPPPGRDEKGWLVSYGGIKEQTINRIVLMGKRRPDLKQSDTAAFTLNGPKYLTVRIQKPATLLEFCQLIRTVEVDYTVRYYQTPFNPESDLRFNYEKKFKLIFEELK